MAEVQVTRWHEIPSLVTARDGDDTVKIPMPQRFQEAIDEAAMRAGAVDSDAYLEGWTHGEWEPMEGSAAEAADAGAITLVASWDEATLQAVVDSYGPADSGSTP